VKTNQVVMPHAGGPDVLRFEQRELPEPGPGEVRLKVEAAGVAFAEVQMLRGRYRRSTVTSPSRAVRARAGAARLVDHIVVIARVGAVVVTSGVSGSVVGVVIVASTGSR
jgi:NADPH:quinone reductase-like Zn-dependent oxidoreductase